MKYYNRTYFIDESGDSLEHRAKYGTANSVSEERGTDGKKNNSKEYNHKYYEEHKDKWKNKNKNGKSKTSDKKQNMSDDDDLFYDPVTGKARFGHKDYDANDPDFNRTDGRKLGDSGLTVFTNSNGSTIVLGKGIKFSFPPGTKITSAMKRRLTDIEKNNDGKNKESYVAKMLNAVTGFAARQKLKDPADGKDFKNNDETNNKSKKEKKSSKKSSSKKDNSKDTSKTTTKSTTKEQSNWDKTIAKYTGKGGSTATAKEKAETATATAQAKGKRDTSYYKKQAKKVSTSTKSTKKKKTSTKTKQNAQFKHFDENGAVVRYFDWR